MADTKITPQGYLYGKEPAAFHPFWENGGSDIEEYVKSVNGTVEETEDGKVYTINYTDGNDEVTKVLDIIVPEEMTLPTDYVTSIVIQKAVGQAQDIYYFTYYTKDGESHGFGTVTVKKDYVGSVEVTGEEISGVNTITIDVDGDESSFDVPTRYLKSVTQSAGQHEDDLFTFTDESGHTTQLSCPGQYVQSLSTSVNNTTAGDHSAAITQRGVVNGSAVNSNLATVHLEDPSHNTNSKYHIDVTNAAGDVAELEWEGGSGSLLIRRTFTKTFSIATRVGIPGVLYVNGTYTFSGSFDFIVPITSSSRFFNVDGTCTKVSFAPAGLTVTSELSGRSYGVNSSLNSIQPLSIQGGFTIDGENVTTTGVTIINALEISTVTGGSTTCWVQHTSVLTDSDFSSTTIVRL